MRAVIYTRVSTKEQTENLSLPTQERYCRDYCQREGFDVVRVFVEEGESAKTLDRTKLVEMFAFCRTARPRIDAVVVYSMSRLARNVANHLQARNLLLSCGTTLRSVTEKLESNANGRFFEIIHAGLAQLDNEVKGERTVAGMKEANKRGRWTWLAPVGYLNSKSRAAASSLMLDPERATFVRQAFELFAGSDRTKEQVLRTVTALGLRTRKGNPLSPQTLSSMLSNPVYAGRCRSWGDEHRGDWEPIISDVLFKQVQLRFARKGRTQKRRDHPDFPLRRFVRCEKCDTPLTGSSSRGRSQVYPYYHCRKCGAVRTPKQGLETAFLDLLAQIQPMPAWLRLFRAIVVDCWQAERETVGTIRQDVERRIDTLNANLNRLDQAFLYERVIDQTTYRTQRDRLRDELAVAQMELGDAKTEELDVEGLLTFAEHVLGNVAALWSHAEVGDKRRLQEAIFPDGLRWNGNGFGTAVTIPAFSWLRGLEGQDVSVASPTGFEPVF